MCVNTKKGATSCTCEAWLVCLPRFDGEDMLSVCKPKAELYIVYTLVGYYFSRAKFEQFEQFDKNLSNSIKKRLNFYNKIFLSRSMLMILPGIITVINPLKNVMINKTFKF